MVVVIVVVVVFVAVVAVVGGCGGCGAEIVYDVRVCPCTPTRNQQIKTDCP